MRTTGSTLGILYLAAALFLLCNVGTTNGYSIFGVLISGISAVHLVVFSVLFLGMYAYLRFQESELERLTHVEKSKVIASIVLPILAIVISVAAIRIDEQLDNESQRRGDKIVALADIYYAQNGTCPDELGILFPPGGKLQQPLVRGSRFEINKGDKENCVISYVSTTGYVCRTEPTEGYWYCDND